MVRLGVMGRGADLGYVSGLAVWTRVRGKGTD